MRDIQFTPDAFEQYNDWLTSNKTIYSRLNKLIIESARTPFEGTGKPEPLKHDLKKDIGADVLMRNTGLFTAWKIPSLKLLLANYITHKKTTSFLKLMVFTLLF